MKKYIKLGSIFLLGLFIGCCSSTSTNYENTTFITNDTKNATSLSAFNDQTYVWENFYYSTNKVEVVK